MYGWFVMWYLSDDLLLSRVDCRWATGASVAKGICSGFEQVSAGAVVWLADHGEVREHLFGADLTGGVGTAIGAVVATGEGTRAGVGLLADEFSGGVTSWCATGTVWPEVAWTGAGIVDILSGDATSTADGHAEWEEVSPGIGRLSKSKTLVLSISSVGSHPVVVDETGGEADASGSVVYVGTVLGWKGETSSDTVEDVDGGATIGE